MRTVARSLDPTLSPLCEAVLMDPICGAIVMDPLRDAVLPAPCDGSCTHGALPGVTALLVVFAAFVALGRQRSG